MFFRKTISFACNFQPLSFRISHAICTLANSKPHPQGCRKQTYISIRTADDLRALFCRSSHDNAETRRSHCPREPGLDCYSCWLSLPYGFSPNVSRFSRRSTCPTPITTAKCICPSSRPVPVRLHGHPIPVVSSTPWRGRFGGKSSTQRSPSN